MLVEGSAWDIPQTRSSAQVQSQAQCNDQEATLKMRLGDKMGGRAVSIGNTKLISISTP